MKTSILIASILAASAAQAQTYDFSVSADLPGFGFGGTFTYSSGVFSNVSITDAQGAMFDQSVSGGIDGTGPLESWVFHGPAGTVAFDVTGPFGTPGIGIENAYEAAPGVPAPGYCEAQPQFAPLCQTSLTTVSNATAAPEIDGRATVTALTLLLGAAALMRGRRSD